MSELHERAKKLTESKKEFERIEAEKAKEKYDQKCLELESEFKIAFSDVLEMLADGEITFKAHFRDPRYEHMGTYIEFTHKNKSVKMDFSGRDSYRYEFIPYTGEVNYGGTMCYGKWPIDRFILWISDQFFQQMEGEEKTYIDDLITGAEYRYNGDERDMTKGNIYLIEKQTEDYIELLDDYKERHQFTRTEYPLFELVSVPVNDALNSAVFNDPNLNEILKRTANNYVTNHSDPEVRRMHGHHVRTFTDGFKMAMTDNKNLREAIMQFKKAVEDESIILQSNTDEETAGYYFQELIKHLQ